LPPIKKKDPIKILVTLFTIIISSAALVVSIYSYKSTKANILKSTKPILYVDDVNLITVKDNGKLEVKGMRVRINNIGLGPAFQVGIKIDEQEIKDKLGVPISLKDNTLPFLPNISNSGKSIGNRSFEASQYLTLYLADGYILKSTKKNEEKKYKNMKFETTCKTLIKDDKCEFTNVPSDPTTVQNIGFTL
jgi:hypothetical protein